MNIESERIVILGAAFGHRARRPPAFGRSAARGSCLWGEIRTA